MTLMQRIGIAFGIGIAFDTVVLAFRTSGISFGGVTLRGVDTGTLYLIIASGAVLLLASVIYRRKLLFATKPKASDGALAAMMAVLALVVWLIFEKYPVFPEFPHPDFQTHVEIAEGLVSGSVVTIPRGILYYGVHFQLASTLVFVGGEPFVTIQRTMGILVILSPLLVYLVAARIFASIGPGIVAAALYVFSGMVWFDSVFVSGLYANFFGLLVALFFIFVFLELADKIRSLQTWFLFGLVVAGAYFSHYTIITVLPAVLAVPVVLLLRSRLDYKRYLIPFVASVAPAGLVVAVRPRIVHFLLYLSQSSGGSLTGSTAISSALAFFPSLSYLALEVNDDIAFIFLFLFTVICIYRSASSKDALVFIPLVWFAALIIAAPQNTSAWRYSYEALVPLVLLASYGLFSVLPRLKIQRRRSGESNALGQYAKVGLVLALLLVPMVVGSWGTTSLSDAVTDTQIQAQSQQSVYSAIMWLKSNTPANSTYLSLTDWRFLYTYIFIGRNTTYQYFGSEDQAIAYARQNGLGYIIVTYLTTISLPSGTQYPWTTYQASSNATLVYSNSDVEIFQVT